MFQTRARIDLSVEAARERIREHLDPLSATRRSLEHSHGLVLAEDVIANTDLPRYTNSAMDGFAVRSSDASVASNDRPVRLSVLGAIDAGEMWIRPVGIGEAVQIGTGAALPLDCDAVIPFEQVHELAGFVAVSGPIQVGSNVRLQGEDISFGTRAIAAGTRLRPQEIGLLAALGIGSVRTLSPPNVSIVSLGSELLPDARPFPTHDANGPMLAAQTERAGGNVVSVDRSSGDLNELSRLLNRLRKTSDLVITSGGISDSNADSMARLLETLPESELWNIRLRPGKHLGAGFFNNHTVVALPGNPVAAFIGFELFGRLAIDRLAGRSADAPLHVARASQVLAGGVGRTDVLRGTAWWDSQGQLHVAQNERRGSGVISSLPEANCLIVLPEHVAAVDPGDHVEIRWLG